MLRTVHRISCSERRKPHHPARPTDVIKTITKLGFVPRHTKGAHVFLKHSDGRTTTVPVHPGEEIDRRLLRKIRGYVSVSIPEEDFEKIVESLLPYGFSSVADYYRLCIINVLLGVWALKPMLTKHRGE